MLHRSVILLVLVLIASNAYLAYRLYYYNSYNPIQAFCANCYAVDMTISEQRAMILRLLSLVRSHFIGHHVDEIQPQIASSCPNSNIKIERILACGLVISLDHTGKIVGVDSQ
mgnify:CR=1 FL=1